MASSKKWHTIPKAAEYLGLSPGYVRHLIHDGKLQSKMVPVSDGSLVEQHVVEEKELNNFLATAPRRNRRSDGRNKFLLYATPVELEESKRVLRAAGRVTAAVADLIEPANMRKPDDS